MATKLTALAVQINAIGVDKVKSALREVETTAARAGGVGAASNQKYALASRNLAGALADVARTGEAGSGSLKKIISTGAEMALMFGLGGPIAAAVGITGLALFNMFDRTRREMEETAKKARAELRSLSIATGSDRAGAIRMGDPFADTEDQRLGIVGIQAKIARMRAAEKAAREASVSRGEAGSVFTGLPSAAELKRLEKVLASMEAEHAGVVKRLNEVAAKEVEVTTIQIRLAAQEKKRNADKIQGEKDLAAATKQRVAEQDRAARNLYQPTGISVGGIPITQTRGAGPDPNFANRSSGNITVKARHGADKVQEISAKRTEKIDEHLKKPMADLAANIEGQMSQTLGDAIYNGFSAAFSGKGLGGIFEAFGKTVLAGVGQIMTQLGMVYIEYGGIMTALSSLLPNPFTAGPAGLAIGAALIGMGAALGAVASGGTGGRGTAGAGGFREPRVEDNVRIKIVPSDVAKVAGMTPSIKQMQFITIGPNDPNAQRAIKKLIENADRRVA